MDSKKNTTGRITCIIPAAGYATRLPNLPCSKEIFPLGINVEGNSRSDTVQVASTTLLEQMSRAGADNAFMIIRKEKWDIAWFLEDGSTFNLNLSYIVTPPTKGTVYSITKSLPFVSGDIILLGFPDIQILEENPFEILLEKLHHGSADIVLGLFETTNPQKADMVETEADGTLKRIEVKPANTTLTLTWLLAAWKPTFTRVIQERLNALESVITHREIYLGDIIQSSIENGLLADTHFFPDAGFTDIGTITDLNTALRRNNL